MQRYCSGDTLRFFMGAMLAWTGSNYPFWGEVATEQADCAMKRSRFAKAALFVDTRYRISRFGVAGLDRHNGGLPY
ncbi:hypothetical protein ACK399_02990 [Aeromonas veronii]|uniref:hypothetical protein n=2 Tax=Aeromonadaceae TaxID=84642 RepID=UPI0030067F0B